MRRVFISESQYEQRNRREDHEQRNANQVARDERPDTSVGLADRDVWRHRLDDEQVHACLLYTSPSPRDRTRSRMPSSA